MDIAAQRARLASRLREARAATGLSGNQFARRLGWQQSRVSKLETGTQMPTVEDVRAWADAAEMAEADRVEMIEVVRAAHVEYATWRYTYAQSGGGAGKQTSLGERERQCVRMAEFWPAMIPGLLQTADYARAAVSVPGGPGAFGAGEDELERIVASRIRRQDILYESGRQLRMVLGEAALWTRFGTVATQLAQLDRLVALSGLVPLDLRIIPRDAAWQVFPLATFKLYDDDMVMLEQPVGEQLIVDPEQVASYTKFFDLLAASALAPDESVALIQRVAADMRE